MDKSLKILHLEDVSADAELVSRELKKSGINGEITIATNKDSFINALKEFLPDIILSDHSLPSFDSHEALIIIKEMGINSPFILVTAAVSEEYAVEIMKEGAIDYVLKDRLQRLPNAIRSAIEKVETEAELANHFILQQKLITETSIQVQEQEREEIGRELHDNINQVLATSKLYLEYAMKTEGLKSELLNKSYETLTVAIEEIRQLSHLLVAPSLGDVTLISAIEELISDIRITKKLHIELITKNFNEESIAKDVKLMLYRIVQEQTNNILRYAQAKNVTVELKFTSGHLSLIINDDGIGFDISKPFKGIGLRNIKNRVGFYDGTISIFSSPGNGCRIEVNIPAKKKIIPK